MIYCWHFLYYHHVKYGHNQFFHHRLLLLCIMVTLWGLRLTYNFWRRGG
jgi:steroid 5-alpha reductase family enzyme